MPVREEASCSGFPNTGTSMHLEPTDMDLGPSGERLGTPSSTSETYLPGTCIQLMEDIASMARDAKYHRHRCKQIMSRMAVLRDILLGLEKKPEEPWPGMLSCVSSIMRELRMGVADSSRSRLFRALNYSSTRRRLQEAYNGMGDCIHAFLGNGLEVESLQKALTSEDEQCDTEFGKVEADFREQARSTQHFVAVLMEKGEVDKEEVKTCRKEIKTLQRELSAPPHQIPRSVKKELREILTSLSTVSRTVRWTHTVPPGILCCICLEPMLDPVSTEVGHSYHRRCIQKWFNKGRLTNPADGQQLSSPVLVANVPLRQTVEYILSTMEPFSSHPQKEWKSLMRMCHWTESHQSRASSVAPAQDYANVIKPHLVETGAEHGPATSHSSIDSSSSEDLIDASQTATSSRFMTQQSVRAFPVLRHCSWTFMGHRGKISAIVSGDRGMFYTASSDRTVRQWEQKMCTAVMDGHLAWIECLLYTPEGSLWSGAWDGMLREWWDGDCINVLQGHKGTILVLTSSPQDHTIYSAGIDGSIRQWQGKRCLRTLEGHASWVVALAVAEDGTLYSGSWDNTVRWWGVGDTLCRAKMEGHTNCVVSLVLGSDGSLFSGSWDMTIRQWRDQACVATLVGHRAAIMKLVMGPNGDLYSSSSDGSIRRWREGMCTATLEGHTGSVAAMEVAPDGTLYTGSWDKTVKQWKDGHCVATLEGHTGPITSLVVSSTGVVYSASHDATIRKWE